MFGSSKRPNPKARGKKTPGLALKPPTQAGGFGKPMKTKKKGPALGGLKHMGGFGLK